MHLLRWYNVRLFAVPLITLPQALFTQEVSSCLARKKEKGSVCSAVLIVLARHTYITYLLPTQLQ